MRKLALLISLGGIISQTAVAGSEGVLHACVYVPYAPKEQFVYQINETNSHCLYNKPNSMAMIQVTRAGVNCATLGFFEFIDSSWGTTCRTDDKYLLYYIHPLDTNNPNSKQIKLEEHVGHTLELNKGSDDPSLYLCPTPSISCNSKYYDECERGYCGDTYMIWKLSAAN